MDRIYSDDKIVIDLQKKNSILTIGWKPGCGNIVEKDISKQVEKIQEMAGRHEPENILFDLSGCSYSITPETGPWYEHKIFTMFDGLEPDKIAYVVPENLFSHIFFEASRARETVDINTHVQYFDKKDKALDWLETDQSI